MPLSFPDIQESSAADEGISLSGIVMVIMRGQDNMAHVFPDLKSASPADLRSSGKHVDTLEVLSADLRIAFEGYFSL